MSNIQDDLLDTRTRQLAVQDEDLQRLLGGDWIRYRTSPALQELSIHAHSVCDEINRTFHESPSHAQRLFRELIPGAGDDIEFRPPISIDYGMRLSIGDRTFINADFMIIGGGFVSIGSDCLIGPRCGIYTPDHAKDIARRLDGWELPQPVTIGNNVWLGGSVTITPGVSIGENSIIGAGSVVTTDIPANVIAVGNPCRPIKPIPES